MVEIASSASLPVSCTTEINSCELSVAIVAPSTTSSAMTARRTACMVGRPKVMLRSTTLTSSGSGSPASAKTTESVCPRLDSASLSWGLMSPRLSMIDLRKNVVRVRVGGLRTIGQRRGGTHARGESSGLDQVIAVEKPCAQSTSEGIAGTSGIDSGDLWRWDINELLPSCHQCAAGAEGENNGVEAGIDKQLRQSFRLLRCHWNAKLGQNQPRLVLIGKQRIGREQGLLIDLDHRGQIGNDPT